MASFKIAGLQKALDDSVPASDLECVNKQYTELTEKYRDKLECTKSLIAFKEEASGYQVDISNCILCSVLLMPVTQWYWLFMYC